MITHITVEDAAKLISWLTNANETQALTYIREAADRGEIQAADTIEKLQAELEQVKQERDEAVEDVAAIIGDVEEIRRGYGVDNADADGAFAVLCEMYCANKGRSCYAECEKYNCKNFKWRGQKEN